MELDFNNKILEELYQIRKEKIEKSYMAKYPGQEEKKANNKSYYKLGFIDAMSLQKQIKEERTANNNSICNAEELQNMFIYKNKNCIKEMLGENIWNRKDYQDIQYQIGKIKKEYPNVRNFIEQSEIVEFNKKEIKALGEYLELIAIIQDIELVEIFKLGLKDNSFL